ncbi:uncharacterized protein BJX67DRAFT_371096 [Aspergillus lucknowensis]|uniref:Uncharacterized protein n=1 Tax=Aspergillus lucknowensis TaxID=176173 RepID=A0ABR4LXC2_9EURO
MADSQLPLTPPSLHYSLAKRKFRILIFWLLVFLDSVVFPIGLYYLLTRTTTLSLTNIFTILTMTLFGTFATESLQRTWLLWKKNSTCRIPNTGRYYFDFTHWNLLGAWTIIIAELVIGTIPDPPWLRILAMPVSSVLFAAAVEMLVLEIMYVLAVPVWFRVSSIPKGDPMRPAIYPFLEDIIAVDGKGGQRYRQSLDRRYNASPPFRGMLHRLTLLWAIPQTLVTGGTMAVIFIADDSELAYTLGWSVPAIWAGIWSVVMVLWTRVELRREMLYWRGKVVKDLDTGIISGGSLAVRH